jgi:hypothetical protein
VGQVRRRVERLFSTRFSSSSWGRGVCAAVRVLSGRRRFDLEGSSALRVTNYAASRRVLSNRMPIRVRARRRRARNTVTAPGSCGLCAGNLQRLDDRPPVHHGCAPHRRGLVSSLRPRSHGLGRAKPRASRGGARRARCGPCCWPARSWARTRFSTKAPLMAHSSFFCRLKKACSRCEPRRAARCSGP